jgi:hypothetical protein
MSVYDEIQTAAVIRYPYLWNREAGKGETEARRDRPVAVGVRIARADGDLALFFPITTKQPEGGRFAFEIPVIEKRRAGLDVDRRLWIVMDEYNADVIGNWLHIEPKRRSAGSAKPSSCRSCASTSRGANPSPKSAATAKVVASQSPSL